MANDKPTISLCMIVKNEEKHIKNCLESAKDFCDEIIVADTGSTDNTVSILKSHCVRLLHFDWIDDFSAARNFVIEQAKTDWIIFLDGDEYVDPAGWQIVLKAIKSGQQDYYDLCQINYTSENRLVGYLPNRLGIENFESYAGYTESWLTRLFRNHNDLRFVGAVHEHLAVSGKIVVGHKLDVKIHHHGQALSREDMQQKKKLYLRIGQKKFENNPSDYKAAHELGVAFWESQQLQDAQFYFEKAKELQPKNITNLIALGTVLQLQKKYNDAEQCFEAAVLIDQNHPEIHACLGALKIQKQDYDAALTEFKTQIRLNPDKEIVRQWLFEAWLKKRARDGVKNPSISVCYIVKNEEDCLGKSLENVKPHVDEIIVLDTGSTDKTMEIAKSHGALVFQEQWRNDFSWARNQSLKHATSEWVLVLDADEVLSDDDWKKLKTLIIEPRSPTYFLKQTTYTNASTVLRWKMNDLDCDEAKGYSGYFESSLVRLFINSPSIRFRGAVHEHAHHDNKDVHPLLSDIRIHHYGKFRDEERMAYKKSLYHNIGIKKLDDMPNEPHAFYEMAVQVWEMGQLDDVEKYLKKALELDPNHKDAVVAYACFLHESKRYADAIDAFRDAIARFPESPDAHLFLSSVLIETKNYDLALIMLRRARELGFSNDVVLAMNEGVILLNQERYQEAYDSYKKAYDLNSTFAPVLQNLAIACLKMKKIDEALQWIDQAIEAGPSIYSSYKLKGEILFTKGEPKDSLEAFEKALEIKPDDRELKAMLAINSYFLGDVKRVIELEQQIIESDCQDELQGRIIEKLLNLYRVKGDQTAIDRVVHLMQQSNSLRV